MPDPVHRPPKPPKRLLIFSQVFVPDPASVGQHIADVAFEMAHRGHRVRVYTANRGYDDPSIKYSPREVLNGVRIRRLPLSSFGKKNIFTRLIGTVSFMLQTILIALFSPKIDAILFSTSPPMIGLALSIVAWVRRIPTAYWAMDLNPDQLIMMGKISPHGLIARTLETANRFILRRTALVIALDRFMADRLRARAKLDHKLLVLPPWPHEQHTQSIDHADNPFRAHHNLAGKFVIMYSGNHSPANPLSTLLQASLQLQDDPDLRFLFVGGGIGKKEIDYFIRDHQPKNVLSLPYQPLADLRYSLSAADLHVVSLGDGMVGIIHPCKIYGAMAVARPILYLGPKPSHIADLLESHAFGFCITHGDVPGAVQTIRRIRQLPPETLREMGLAAQTVLQQNLSQTHLCDQFCDSLASLLYTPGKYQRSILSKSSL